jgi:hypothetical protein
MALFAPRPSAEQLRKVVYSHSLRDLRSRDPSDADHLRLAPSVKQRPLKLTI